jgi:sugar/nucleoside kinase (ribokinase family)
MDLVVTAPKRPKAGETLMGDSFKTFPGGKGANQAVAASRLGAEVNMVGCVGNDRYGEGIVKNLQQNGVNTDFVEVVNGESGTAHIVIAEEDNSLMQSIQQEREIRLMPHLPSLYQKDQGSKKACNLPIKQLPSPSPNSGRKAVCLLGKKSAISK